MSSTSTRADPVGAGERETFLAAWHEFMAAVRRARSRTGDQASGGLTSSQLHLLIALEDTPSLSVGELAQAAGVSSPTATRMLDCLERDGIVRRRPAADDRRRIAVEPTAKGRRALTAARTRLDERCDLLYARLPDDERDRAAHLLALLTEAIEGV